MCALPFFGHEVSSCSLVQSENNQSSEQQNVANDNARK